MKTLKIYFTSDTHGAIFPTDYTDNTIKNMGLFAISSSIEKDTNTLILDGGDTIQGSPFATYILDKTYEIHPISHVMNLVGYDYVTLGNHDFNYGYDYLMNYLNDLNATVLCANVKDISGKFPNLIQSSVIHTLDNGIRVGIVGLTTEYINVFEKKEHLSNFTITDPFSHANDAVLKLKSSSDIVVGIYHGGFENDINTHEPLAHTSENIAYKLCKNLDFDILLTGHQHIPISGKSLFGTHIVQTPMHALKYAEINVSFTESNIPQMICSHLLVPTVKPLTEKQAAYNVLQNDIQTWLDEYVGQLDIPLEAKSHLDMATQGSSISNFLNQIQLDASGADISLTSLANTVMGLPQKVSLRDIVSTYIYPNTLVVIKITGEILKKALERSAEYFDVIEREIQISERFLKPKVEHYNYDYFSGVNYTFDLKKPIGKRVTSMKFNGISVKNNQTFKLVMNNYRASGAGGYEFYADCPVIEDIQISTTDLVTNYIKKNPVIEVDKSVYLKIIKPN